MPAFHFDKIVNWMYKSIALNEYSEYIRILNYLEKAAKHIEYVLIDEDDTCLIDAVQADIYAQKDTNEWWGTQTSRRACLYRIKASPKLFSLLKKFSTFCVIKSGNRGIQTETTDFGINDIAFFDDKSEPILFTTTHEGIIELRNDAFCLLYNGGKK